MTDIPYRKVCGDMGYVSLKPMKPTGRWKIETTPYYRDKIFVEQDKLSEQEPDCPAYLYFSIINPVYRYGIMFLNP